MNNVNTSKIATVLICTFMLGAAGLAYGKDDGFKALNPSSLPPAHGYSHILIAPVGRLVTISGQVAMDGHGNIVGKENFKAQCAQVFENIRSALHAAGLTFKNVITTDMFVTDLNHLAELRECRTHYLPEKNPPAANLVVVESLFRPELMLEVSVQAVMPRSSDSQ